MHMYLHLGYITLIYRVVLQHDDGLEKVRIRTWKWTRVRERWRTGRASSHSCRVWHFFNTLFSSCPVSLCLLSHGLYLHLVILGREDSYLWQSTARLAFRFPPVSGWRRAPEPEHWLFITLMNGSSSDNPELFIAPSTPLCMWYDATTKCCLFELTKLANKHTPLQTTSATAERTRTTHCATDLQPPHPLRSP